MDDHGSHIRADARKARRHIRHAIDLVARVSADRGDHVDHEPGRMVDISEGGLCFVGIRYLPPGTLVEVEFEDCRVSGEVRHCKMREYAPHTEYVTGVMVREVLAGHDSWKI